MARPDVSMPPDSRLPTSGRSPFCPIPGGDGCVSRHAQNFLGFAREVENIEFRCVCINDILDSITCRSGMDSSGFCYLIENEMKRVRTASDSYSRAKSHKGGDRMRLFLIHEYEWTDKPAFLLLV